MNNQRHRENFIARLAKHNIRPDDARKLLRYARTLHRLAEAQCNGDWPCGNGERKVEPCAKCEGLWVPSVLKRHPYQKRTPKPLLYCPDCRTKAHVRALCASLGIEPEFQGDPRGCVLKLRLPGDPGDIDGLVGVP